MTPASPSPTTAMPRALLAVSLCMSALAVGCGERIDPVTGFGGSRQPAVAYPEQDRDLAEISRSGVLRMVARYNSSSYFVHKGGQAGFDYELLVRFARLHGLTVETVVPGPDEDEITILNSGRGDLVCTGWTPDDDLGRWVDWTRPTNFVRKAVVMRVDDPRGPGLADLNTTVLTLPAGDPFKAELMRLRREHGARFRIADGRPLAAPEELLALVDKGELQAVVVDDVIARAAMTYLKDIRIVLRLGEQRPVVWLVRQNSPELKAELNRYLKDHLAVAESGRRRRSELYGTIYDRYFEDGKTIRGFQEEANRPDKSGRISGYDDLIRRQAAVYGLDWRLVAALIYQESRFYPQARSKADARGLMQVLPQFAGDQSDSLFVPEANLRAGTRLLKAIWNRYAYLDSLERTRFVLAEYHAGNGHLTDARRLAMDLGRDPNRWEGSLATTLPLLMEQRWFSRTHHGFYRGTRTVDYVEEILARYRAYTRLLPRDPAVIDTLRVARPDATGDEPSDLPALAADRPPPE